MTHLLGKLFDQRAIVILSIRQQLGRRFWLLPIFVLAWPLLAGTVIFLFGGNVNFGEDEIQNIIIGLPLYAMAIGMGAGIITNEIEQRTLEVTYTIPGGARRVWLLKLSAAALFILMAELMMAVSTWLIFMPFPLSVLPGAFRGAIFLLVLAMGFGALLKNELFAAITAGGLSFFILIMTMEENIGRWSPLFDPRLIEDISTAEVIAWSIQNYVGVTLVTVALAALAFSRAERREQLLG
jgi:hypothetical protein